MVTKEKCVYKCLQMKGLSFYYKKKVCGSRLATCKFIFFQIHNHSLISDKGKLYECE
jgi:hypothetical protein